MSISFVLSRMYPACDRDVFLFYNADEIAIEIENGNAEGLSISFRFDLPLARSRLIRYKRIFL